MKISYGLALYFDQEFNETIVDMWKYIRSLKIADSMYRTPEIEPHITLAGYSEVCKEKLSDMFLDLKSRDLKSERVYFDSISIFKTTQVICMKPNISPNLLNYLNVVHEVFDTCKDYCNQYYTLARWNPHITLLRVKENDPLGEIMGQVLEHFTISSGLIKGIVFAEIVQEDDGRIIEVTTIDRYQFSE